MANNTPSNATGNAPAVPKPQEPRWVTTEEAKQFQKYLRKNFVPKDDPKFAKKYFYKVESIIPYTPAGFDGAVSQTCLNFLLQKYDRTKQETVSVSDGNGGKETIERPAKVEGHRLNEEGFWECIDSTASRMIDVRKFKEEFESDKFVGDED